MEPSTALFPPGKGGGEGVAIGRKGKGVLIHVLTEGNGMPLAATTTPANANERDQVEPLLDAVVVHTGKPGRPRKRLGTLATDRGYDSAPLRRRVRQRGIRPQIPKRRRPGGARRVGRPIEKRVPRWQMERVFAWLQRKYRRLVVRWERRKVYFDGFVQLGIILTWADALYWAGVSG